MAKKKQKTSERVMRALGISGTEMTQPEASKPTFNIKDSKTEIPKWAKRVPFDEYLKDKRVSSHSLMDFDHSPKLYKRKQDGIAPGLSSDSLTFGTASHVYIVQGADAFKREYEVGGLINEKTGKPYGNTSDKQKEYAGKCGKTIISDSDYDKICCMKIGIDANESASNLFWQIGHAEICIYPEISEMKSKMRLDWWIPELQANVDLKTTKSIDTFVDDFWKYKYDIQIGFFGISMRQIVGYVPEFYIIATEKEEPYRCKVYEITPSTMHDAMKRVSMLMFELQGAIMDDEWEYGTEIDGVI